MNRIVRDALHMRRAFETPDQAKCVHCAGLGTRIIEKDVPLAWLHREAIECKTCQRTGLKAIPEGEVIWEGR